MSSAETPSNNKRISLSNSFSDDQGYHGSGAEHEGKALVAWLPKVFFLVWSWWVDQWYQSVDNSERKPKGLKLKNILGRQIYGFLFQIRCHGKWNHYDRKLTG